MKRLRQTFQDRLGDAGTQAEENLSSIRTVRTFSGEGKACASYGADVNKSYAVGKKLSAAGGKLTLVMLNPDIPFLCKQCRSRSVGF